MRQDAVSSIGRAAATFQLKVAVMRETQPLMRAIAWASALIALAAGVWGVTIVTQRGASAQVSPRQVASRGALFSSEQALIELFEKSRGSVVFISRRK
jgi:hypothetical protein